MDATEKSGTLTEQQGTPLSLGTGDIFRLLLQYAIPSVIAMTASSLYNITDSVFIGLGVGALAISGLTITFPLMNLAAAFGSLVGAGAATLMSIRLGQKDYSMANRILGNVFTLNLILGSAFTLLVLLFLDPILLFFGASEATLPYAHEYMVVILLGNVVTHMYLGLNAMLRATGSPRKAMLATILTVIINLVLTPFFIYVLKMGIKGAALATIISQVLMLTWQISIFSNKSHFIHLQKGIFRLKARIVKDTFSIGLAPFLMNAVASGIVIVLNHALLRHGGDLAVGAFGIVNRVAFLFAMIVFGINQGMQPIAGYNFGAKLYGRVNSVLKQTILLATAVTSLGFVLAEIFPQAIVSLFTRDEELIGIAIPAVRIVFIFFPIVGFQMVTSNFFQSIGMAGKAIFMSLSRQLFFLLPGLLILPHFFQLPGVWYSMPAADLLSSLIAAGMLYSHYRSFRRLEMTELKNTTL
ncbi:MAG: MATE family efflux transporter [Bacteroidota bacterium]